MEILNTKNLSFYYPESKVPALSEINLTIKQGEFITVCGKSGCGKSTLLKMFKPALTPHGKKTGDVLFYGNDIQALDLKSQSKKIGFVFQNPDNQIVCDKVWHELAFGLENSGIKTSEIRLKVSETASFFGIQNWFHKNTNELSGGQKQLLNLASVMIMQPEILILDEPTSQLDPISAQEFLSTLSKINRELGTTLIISEHRLEDVLVLSDKVIVLENGSLISFDVPKAVGRFLKETNNPMFSAMPAAMRIFREISKEIPLTVREGRNILTELSKKLYITPFEDNFERTAKKDGTIIEFKDLWFRYDKKLPDIIKGASGKIYSGELYALLGGNGTGKTTLLYLIAELFKPYRGKITHTETAKTGECTVPIALLPQNPQNIFVKSTVKQDFYEVLSKTKLSDETKEAKVMEIAKFCEIETLLNRHPYDLSGGEQQRAALCKILLLKPKILLLDEPTKGLDAHFKKKLINILNKLKESGMAIVMVSHDIEFCAENADRCGMFFDGNIISEDIPRKFFNEKTFYTTAASRISRGIIENAVLNEDIIKSIHKERKLNND